jgi:hypothetical protein
MMRVLLLLALMLLGLQRMATIAAQPHFTLSGCIQTPSRCLALLTARLVEAA